MNIRSLFGLLVLAVITLPAIGCGDSNLPSIGRVHGKVTINGQPVQDAMVSFEPVEGGRSAWAMTDANGEYELKYSGNANGTRTGDNTVRLTSAVSATYDDNGRVVKPATKERFPPEYNTESTQLVTVESGNNEINFEVLSDK